MIRIVGAMVLYGLIKMFVKFMAVLAILGLFGYFVSSLL